MQITRIVSGGQAGADRAALDVAIELGIDYGGWCPAGGWAEDLPDPPGLMAVYPRLTATSESDPSVRTRLNVRDSDATLIVWDGECDSRGSQLTLDVAREIGRPVLATCNHDEARAWLVGLGAVVVLNVAGPRESSCPGSYTRTVRLLRALLT